MLLCLFCATAEKAWAGGGRGGRVEEVCLRGWVEGGGDMEERSGEKQGWFGEMEVRSGGKWR